MAEAMEVFRNRVVGFGTRPASQFQANPRNWRKHPMRQRTAVRASLRELGWVDVVIENVRTGHLIDGHERIWQALEADQEVPYVQVDLSEEEEVKALLLLDPLAGMAETDREMMAELSQVVTFDDADLAAAFDDILAKEGMVAIDFGEAEVPDEDVPYKDNAEIRIVLADFSVRSEVVERIKKLLDEHPEWGAKIA